MELTVLNQNLSDALRFLDKPQRLHFCDFAKLGQGHSEVIQEPKIYPFCLRVVGRTDLLLFIARGTYLRSDDRTAIYTRR